ncbi:hypothetical protein AOLI_G00116360 [Acnodon oligacanthus]
MQTPHREDPGRPAGESNPGPPSYLDTTADSSFTRMPLSIRTRAAESCSGSGDTAERRTTRRTVQLTQHRNCPGWR